MHERFEQHSTHRGARRAGLVISAALALSGMGAVIAEAASTHGAAAPASTGPRVYATTLRATSAQVHSTLTVAVAGGATSTATSTGSFDWSRREGNLVTTVTTNGRALTSTQNITVGDVTYTRIRFTGQAPKGSLLSELPGVSGWGATVLADTVPGAYRQAVLGLLGDAPSQLTPAAVLGLLRAPVRSVTDLGTQSLAGVTTTHYREGIDLTKLGLPAADRAAAEAVVAAGTVSVDYWVDAAHRLRQLRLAVTDRAGASSAHSAAFVTGTAGGGLGTTSVTVSLTMDLSGFGAPVHVALPAGAKATSRQTCTVTVANVNCG